MKKGFCGGQKAFFVVEKGVYTEWGNFFFAKLKKRMGNLGFIDGFCQNMKRDPIYIWLFLSLLTIHSFNAL